MVLRVLTMNLYNGAADPARFASLLEAHEPDVVAVQELADEAAAVLDEWSETALLDPRDDTTGMGMASSAPLAMRRLAFPHRNPILGTFDGTAWGLPRVDLLNVHFVNPIARPLRISHQQRSNEVAALESLLQQHDTGTARIVVGDFNSSPAWPFYKRVAALARDGAVEAGTARRTWSYYPWSPRMLRIDHVFLQGPIRCVGTRLLSVPGADHRGLLIDLEPFPQGR